MISSVETGNGRFGQIGGFKFSFDPDMIAGNRIQNLALVDPTTNTSEAIVRNSELVVPTDRIFTVTTSRFSATGGDNYPLVIQNIRGLTDFAEPDSLGNADLASGRLQDAVAEYFAATYNTDKSQAPFAQADTPQAGDTRIQNLSFRSDTVLPEVTPPQEIVFGTNGNDELWAGLDFSGINSTVFAGAGNDEIDVPVGGASKGFNRIDAGSGQDVIYAGNGDRVSGGSGNDELDATDASGYRLSGGSGDDLFFLGTKGRAIGGDGNDKFYVQSGGDNLLTGGAGADQFWLLTDVAPDIANTVVDFTKGTDVIGIASQGASVNFASLTRTGNSIALNGDVFAILTGFNTTTLTAADFVFM
jgi:Ca2+-binding RTX toxin-like protein